MWSQKFKNGTNTKSVVGVMPTWNKRSNPRRPTGIAARRMIGIQAGKEETCYQIKQTKMEL
jgi:hypothetical protein